MPAIGPASCWFDERRRAMPSATRFVACADDDMPNETLLTRLGNAMRRYRGAILGIQWCVVILYLALLIVPAFMPIPAEDAHVYDNLRMFAQFLFWGIWWPFVMLSMMLFVRVWGVVFCPEGALTELASRHGLGKAIPHWMRWSGWPLLAFASTTIYGQ